MARKANIKKEKAKVETEEVIEEASSESDVVRFSEEDLENSGLRELKASANPIIPIPVDLVIADGVSDESNISTFLLILNPSFSISL